MKKIYFLFLFALIASVSNLWAAEVTDVITAADLKATEAKYIDFSNLTFTSGAQYSGSSAKDPGTSAIQLRSKNSNSGIVSVKSGGTIKSVTLTFASNNKNTVDVYGNNVAYSLASDLYDTKDKSNPSNQGTKVGSLSKTGTITFTDNYSYIGIRSNSGAVYISKIEITYEVQTSNVATPTFTPASGDVNMGSKITMATATEGATISYSTDEGTTWTEGAEYTATTKGALTLWAKATKDGEESAVAKTTFNVIDPNEIGEIVVNVTADKTAASDKYFGTMTVNVPMPANATEMEVVIKKDGAAYSSDKNMTKAFSKEIKETGKYVITVTANNDKDINSNEETPKTVDFYSSSLGSIAEFLLYAPENETVFGKDLEYAFTCPLTVTYANGNNLWVTDGTDGLLIYDKTATYSYANGTVFSAGLKGTYTVYNQTIELTKPTLTATSTGAEASPKAIKVADIKADNQNQYVIIADGVFNSSKKTLADASGNTVTCYTGKNYCTVPEDGTYDVVGIINYFGKTEASAEVQVYPLAFLSKPVVTAGFPKAEIAAKPWLAEKDEVLTTEEEDLNASCVKLTCQDGAQIVYSLQGSESKVEGTADSGVELPLEKDIYELTVQTLADGFKGVAVTYTFIVGDTSSVSKVSAEDGVKVVAAEGGVEVVAAEAADVAVYTVAGQLVCAERVAEGSTLVNVPAGFYVVRAAGAVAKVVVK